MFSTTALLVVLGIFWKPEMAAEVGVVHAATLATFLVFSANARNLILGNESDVLLHRLFLFRAILLLPLSVAAYLLSKGIIESFGIITVLLILRRCMEWLAELQITKMEKEEDARFAYVFVGIQCVSFALVMISLGIGGEKLYWTALAVWAVSPMATGARFLLQMLLMKPEKKVALRSLAPHVGSSWIIGISTYLFRVVIVLVAGERIGGLLFAAYAIGGMINSIYTYALGPSLALHNEKAGVARSRGLGRYVVAGLCIIGLAILAVVEVSENIDDPLLFRAIGFSLIGGGIMILAQHRRITILQLEKSSVFVQDVFANILIVATVPFVFYLFGQDVLSGLFLWSAILTYGIYMLPSIVQRREEPSVPEIDKRRVFPRFSRSLVQAWVIFFLSFPIFFQLDGGVFSSPDMFFDSERLLTRVPLPVSIVACFSGIALLVSYKKANLSASILFFLFLSMAISVFVVSAGSDEDKSAKLIFMMQFVLPVFALLLGQLYVQPENHRLRYESVFLYVLVLILPAEVLATIFQNSPILTPYLYVFSIYQHVQYVPMILVGMYTIAAVSLSKYNGMRVLLLVLAPFLGAYVASSLSTLALSMTVVGVLLIFYTDRKGGSPKFSILVGLLVVVGMGWYWLVYPQLFNEITETGLMTRMLISGRSLSDYLTGIYIYLKGITESPVAFIFGHAQRMDGNLLLAGHNYYLDLVYNYGVITAVPFLYLVEHTLVRLVRIWKAGMLSFDLLCVSTIVLFYVLVANSFGVSLRQPYPAIVEFFLWGILLNELSTASSRRVIQKTELTV